jgi:hypothetical protein
VADPGSPFASWDLRDLTGRVNVGTYDPAPDSGSMLHLCQNVGQGDAESPKVPPQMISVFLNGNQNELSRVDLEPRMANSGLTTFAIPRLWVFLLTIIQNV